MLTDQPVPANSPGDLDNLIKNFEYENQQYVKLIEKENQQIEALEKDIGDRKANILSIQADITKLDEDTKRAHKQYTRNRDNCQSLKTTVGVLKEHVDALTKRLAFIIQNGEQEVAERSGMLQHYADILKEYKTKYNTFPLYKKLEVEQSHLLQLENEVQEAEAKINQLRCHINGMKGVHGSELYDVTKFIIKLAEMKVNTEVVKKDIRKAEAEKIKTQIQTAEAKAKKDKEIEQQIAEKERERALQEADVASSIIPQRNSNTSENYYQKEQDDKDSASSESVMISMFSDKEGECGITKQLQQSQSGVASVMSMPGLVATADDLNPNHQPVPSSTFFYNSSNQPQFTVGSSQVSLQSQLSMESSMSCPVPGVSQQVKLPVANQIQQQVVPQSPSLQHSRPPRLQPPSVIKSCQQQQPQISVFQSLPLVYANCQQETQIQARQPIRTPGIVPPNSPVESHIQGRYIPQFIVPSVGSVVNRDKLDQSHKLHQPSPNLTTRHPSMSPRFPENQTVRNPNVQTLRVPEKIQNISKNQPMFPQAAPRLQTHVQDLHSLPAARQSQMPFVTVASTQPLVTRPQMPFIIPKTSVPVGQCGSFPSTPNYTEQQSKLQLENQFRALSTTQMMCPPSSKQVVYTAAPTRSPSIPNVAFTSNTASSSTQSGQTPACVPSTPVHCHNQQLEPSPAPKTPENLTPSSSGNGVSPFSIEKHQEKIKSLSKSPGAPTYTQRPMFQRENSDENEKNVGNEVYMGTFFNQFVGRESRSQEQQPEVFGGFGDAQNSAKSTELSTSNFFSGFGDGHTNDQTSSFFGGFGSSGSSGDKDNSKSIFFSRGLGMSSPDLGTTGSQTAFNFGSTGESVSKGSSFMSLFGEGDAAQDQINQDSGFSFSFGSNDDQERPSGAFSLF